MLVIQDLVKKYGDFTAVDHLSIALQPGEIFGLLGPNGAGKTSTIATIVSLEEPTSGSVKVFGFEVADSPKKVKSLLGYVPQEIVNHGYFSVEEILKFHSGYFGRLNNKKQIHFLLERLGLMPHKDKKVKHLSGGMKRRLLIAKALVHKPKLLLLDEPTAGVDIELRNSLWEFVRELRDSGVTILLTTHYLEEAEALCDRVGILHQGRLQKVGPTKELIQDLTFRRVQIKTNLSAEDLKKVKGEYSLMGSTLNFKIPSEESLGALLAKTGLPLEAILDISIQEGSLEEAFLNILGRA